MKKIYVILFAILYLIVAFISTLHSIEFFNLSNNYSMAIMLACAFEIGQAAVLFALLTTPKERSKVMPWILMSIFTLVQILGNIYACYKHIMLNSQDLLVYFKEPIFIWTNLPDAQANVIVTYICGGILPLCALALTSMVTNQLDPNNKTIDEIAKEQEEQESEQKKEEIIKNEVEEEIVNVLPKQEPEIIEEDNEQEEIIEEPTEQPTKEVIYKKIKNEDKTEPPISQEIEDIMDGNIVPTINYPKQKSHFVNI